MTLFYTENTKQFNVSYHPDIASRIDQLSLKNNNRLNKTALLKQALDLYFEDFQLGKVKPSKKIRKARNGKKPRYSAYIEESYWNKFDELTQSLKEEVKQNTPSNKAITYTKSKVLEDILEYWLEKEGYKYE